MYISKMNCLQKALNYRKFISSLIFMLDSEISSFMTENFYKIILFAHACETIRIFYVKF